MGQTTVADQARTRGFAIFLVLWVLMLAACAGGAKTPALVYIPEAPAAVQAEHIPTFLVDDAAQPFNRIGTPAAREQADGDPLIIVDPEHASLYFEAQEFTTARGSYTNLIYRIHFSEVPFLWTSPRLTSGANPGLLIIYTLDRNSTLLLVTTVHTCGCYLAFMPTSAMPPDFLPLDWSPEPQDIYGQTLPGQLPLPQSNNASRLLFSVESETHRIRDAVLSVPADFNHRTPLQEMRMRPMLDLYSLPYRDKTVSFFENEGPRHGYVKNNTKIIERLLMSWWAFDLYVGEDKAYSLHDDSETVFYTSLKFWERTASDLKNFAKFLDYWGWRL